VLNVFWIVFFLSIGLLIEKLVIRQVRAKYFQIDRSCLQITGQGERIKASIINALPQFIGLFLFFGASYISFMIFDPTGTAFGQLVFLALLLSIVLVRSISIIAKILLSPAVFEFRFLPVDCRTAGNISRLVTITFGYIITVLMFSVVIKKLGAQQSTVLLIQLFGATVLILVTIFFILYFRKKVQNYILTSSEGKTEGSWGPSQFAAIWHILAILYLVTLWLLLINSITSPETNTRGAFLLSFFVVPLYMIADRIVQWIVGYAFNILKIHQNQYEDAGEIEEEIVIAREKGRLLYQKSKNLARAGLILAISIWIAGLWQIKIPFFSGFAKVALDALIILTLALIFWQFTSSWIEKKIQESLPEEEEEKQDDEWGGAASQGRSYTLLPMIRKFIASVLVIMVTMTILSSMGVDIGPLLAGAGVVGLAVGFGAQKLVSDMFSGFFYLLDDAFRVGEYLTAGSVSGTVEAITLRNIMLRHHRGMLQIVPHSELGAITNFMRGGMIVKFNLDFPYDTDIDKVRKIIKKVGIAMLDDPDIGKDFIQPVKSQGVREITNSVMTIRVKFTAQPGTHFVIRREAYKRITEALKANGIEYAHKKVIVDVPGLAETTQDITPEMAKTITNAAGAAAQDSTEEILKSKPADTLS
jgi:small-conductance mechanosensitive channel